MGNNNDEANNGDYNDLEYAFNFGSTQGFSIRKAGVYLGEGLASAGDIFRIEIASNGNIVFSKNGTAICLDGNCSFTNPQNYPVYLVFKSSEYTGKITNVNVSSNSSGGTLTAPTNLQAANEVGNNINLSWQSTDSGISGFKLERKLGTQGVYSEIATINATARTYVDTSAKTANRPYIYRIRAFINSNNGNYSNEAGTVTPYTGNAAISTDREAVFPYIAPPLPLAGQKFFDESFGTQIMRVTDETDGFAASASGSHAEYPASFSTAYAIWSTFNSDNTRLFFISPSGSGAFFIKFDPINFRRISGLVPLPPSPDGGLVQEGLIWSRFNPNVFYSVVGKKLYQGTITDSALPNGQPTFTFTVIKDFTSEIRNGFAERFISFQIISKRR